MTPKEKAIDLILKFAPYSEDNINIDIYKMIRAKCCALIAVDEILDTSPKYYTGFEYECDIDYWLKVKSEIEALYKP